ncbi:hypothetical protein G6F63_015616 [Rhizopus arrhizus]|nr:hypothetical protein G6F63_015616 [Rhizopus arrhizus]
MQVIGVAGHFDQATVMHLFQLCPGDEVVMPERAIAIVDGAPRRHVHVVGDHRHQRRIAVGLEQGEGLVIDTAQAVVEGQQHRLGRQRGAALRGLDHLRQRDRVVAVSASPLAATWSRMSW